MNSVFKSSIRHFIHTKINSGVILLFVALVAMIVANSPLKEAYDNFFSQELVLSVGGYNLFQVHGENMTIMSFINDALMVIFFFSVGLEIKHEMLVGELSSFRKALLPIVAACGGMIVPIVLFALICPEGVASRGAAIPMATDIAFSLGVLSLLGSRVPLSLKIFLTALAVVDDIGGIIVIGAFYSSNLELLYLLLAAFFVLVLSVGGRFGVHNWFFYIFFGSIVWWLFLNSGIHPTIAGVIVAFAIPARSKYDIPRSVGEIRESLAKLPETNDMIRKNYTPSNSDLDVLRGVEYASSHVVSPLQAMSDWLQPIVNYLVMPLFAFANASITFEGFSMGDVQGVTLTVFIALVFGKLLGIFSFSWISIKCKWLRMPDRMDNRGLFGMSMLGGIGFTVSLFLANLSYTSVPEVGATLLNQAKMGIIGGSVFAGICGYLLLSYFYPKKEQ